MFAALKEIGYDGVVSIELEDVPGVSRGPNSNAPGVYRNVTATDEFVAETVAAMNYLKGSARSSTSRSRTDPRGTGPTPRPGSAFRRRTAHFRQENLVYVGTYTEPILFGTGQVLQGKGEGIYCFVFDPDAGTLTPHFVAEGVRNPSYLCLDRDRSYLYCVNEFKEYEGKPSGRCRRSASTGDRRPDLAQHQALARHRPLPPRHRPLGPLRADRQLRLRLDLRAADPRGRLARRRDRLGPARGIERRSPAADRPARPCGRLLRRRPLRLRPGPRDRRGDHLRLRPRDRQARLRRPAQGQDAAPAPVPVSSSCIRRAATPT